MLVKKENNQMVPMEELFLIPKNYKFLLEGVVYGQHPSMKNRNRIITKNGRPSIIHSKEVYIYEHSFEKFIKTKPEWKIQVGGRDQQLAIYAAVYYKTYMSDPSIDLFLDMLQKHEVITNDRWVRQKHYWAGISKTAPRLHFRLYELPQDWLIPNFALKPIIESE